MSQERTQESPRSCKVSLCPSPGHAARGCFPECFLTSHTRSAGEGRRHTISLLSERSMGFLRHCCPGRCSQTGPWPAPAQSCPRLSPLVQNVHFSL